MEIKDIIDFFSPYSKEFQTAIEDFHGFSQEEYGALKKTAVVALAILGGLSSFFILGLGAIPVFRWAVSWFKSKEIGEGDQRNREEEMLQRGAIPEHRYRGEPPRDPYQRALRALQEQTHVLFEGAMLGPLRVPEIRASILRELEALNFALNPHWYEEDLHNGSPLQRFYEFIDTPILCAYDFNTDLLTYPLSQLGSWPRNHIQFIQTASLGELIAISTYFVKNEMMWRDANDNGRDVHLNISLVFCANEGICEQWRLRLLELLREW